MRGTLTRAFLVVAMVVVMPVTIGGCGNGGNGEGNGGGNGGGQDYPEEVVNQFMSSCTDAGTSAEVCQCALDRFEEKYSIEEFQEESVRLSEGQPSEEFSQDLLTFSVECQEEAG